MQQIHHDVAPNLIFHLAALSSVAASWQAPANVLRVNAIGFIHLVEAVRSECPTARIIVVGSGGEYGYVLPEDNPVTEETLLRPMNPYAVSKATQDLYAFQFHKAYSLDIVRARPFNHFGPGQSADFVIASFARQIAQMEFGLMPPTLLVGNLSSQRDFLSVDDVVRAYIRLADGGRTRGTTLANCIQTSADEICSHFAGILFANEPLPLQGNGGTPGRVLVHHMHLVCSVVEVRLGPSQTVGVWRHTIGDLD
jgi:nucleoside-diphosphate-sugar epimerase